MLEDKFLLVQLCIHHMFTTGFGMLERHVESLVQKQFVIKVIYNKRLLFQRLFIVSTQQYYMGRVNSEVFCMFSKFLFVFVFT